MILISRGFLAGLLLVLGLFAQEPSPKSVRSSVKEGMNLFRAGKIKESVEAFTSATKLRPDVKPYLWQLGISYYYLDEFEKGRRLFELHQSVNPQDVENAIWHFLCVSRLEGVSEARKAFIRITDDTRVPMKELHSLFAGQGTAEEVMKAAQDRESVFYAHLYLGLYEEALHHEPESLDHIRKAATEYEQGHFMGAVAKVHLKLRSAEKAAAPKK